MYGTFKYTTGLISLRSRSDKSLSTVKNRCKNLLKNFYKTFKTGTYFQLKSRSTLLLCSNVVYKFSCSCDLNLTYIGKSTRQLSTREGEHLNVASQHENSAIKHNIFSCTVCSNVRHDV